MNGLWTVLRRLALSVGTLLSVSVVLFAGSEMVPGDAASASLGVTSTPGEVAERRHDWGLDRPLPIRFLDWAGHAVRGDLGTSLITRRPVTEMVAGPLADTALLVLLAGGLTVVASLMLGTVAGLRPGSRLDRMLSGAALVTVSIPQFVTAGLLASVFASALGILPAVSLVPLGGSPLDRPEILVLPVVSLAAFATAWASRLVRATVVDANAAAHVEAARLAGLPEWTVVRRHLLPGTVAPCAQAFAWLVSGLFGGTAVVERVFNYPGLSRVLLDAVRHHDSVVLEGVGLLLAAIIVGGLLLADLIGVLANPKLRTGTR
jgi:peptide/nickel transport system permease protein